MLKVLQAVTLSAILYTLTYIGFTVFQEYFFTVQTNDVELTHTYGYVANDDILDPMIRLYGDDGSFCSGVVIDGQYALTAAHCVMDSFGFLKDDSPFYVKDVNLSISPIKVKAVALEKHRDIALLKGDFRRFKAVRVDFDGVDQNVVGNAQVVLCGFPSGGEPFCTSGVTNGNYLFRVKIDKTIIYKGMSGGPVAILGEDGMPSIIGVNSAATEEYDLIGPVVGVRELWGI